MIRGICEEKKEVRWLAPLGTEGILGRCGEREGELNISLEGCGRHLQAAARCGQTAGSCHSLGESQKLFRNFPSWMTLGWFS